MNEVTGQRNAATAARTALIIGLNYAPEFTGIAPYTTALAEGLIRRGFHARAVVAFPHYPAWRIHDGYRGWSRRKILQGVDVTRVLHYVPRDPSGLRRLLSEITFGVRAACTRWRAPSVVVMVSPALFSTAITLLKARIGRSSPPVVVWVQDIYSLGITETGSGGPLTSRIAALVERHTFRAADGVVVIHPKFRDYLVATLRVDPSRVQVVPNWTHLEPNPILDTDDVRKRLGWAADETIVLHAGNMGVKQGLGNVVEAARLADAGGHPVRFVLLGQGTQKTALQDLGVGVKCVQFVDSLGDEEFQGALRAADILLVNEMPGVSEMAVPSKLTSYFDAGRPVIVATDPEGLAASEIYASEGGRVVGAGAPRSLLDEVLALRADKETADRLGANGRRYRMNALGETEAIDDFAQYLTQIATSGPLRRQPRRADTPGRNRESANEH